MHCDTTTVVVDTPQLLDAVRIQMEVKRYTSRKTEESEGGLTLVFAHGTTSYKEMWEPVIETLFRYQLAASNLERIREVWSLEWPSHGESAVLNEDIIQTSGVIITSKEWAAAVADFCRKYLASRRVVCIAHSVGAYAVLNATRSLPAGFPLPYEAIIVIEPGIISRHALHEHLEERRLQLSTLMAFAKQRRHEWPSRHEASLYLAQRAPWNSWDPRVLRLFVDYGLRPVHTNSQSVTLKCPAHVAAETCSEAEMEQSIQAMEQLEVLSDQIPIHVMIGEYNDLIPPYYNDCFTELKHQSKIASLTVMQDAGHSIPEEKPDKLAEYIWALLSHGSRSPSDDERHDRSHL